MVAVVWAAVFASANRTRLTHLETILLALVVWLIYTCDRLLDGRRSPWDFGLKDRHVFCLRNRGVLISLAVAVAAMVFFLALYLPPPVMRAGMILGLVLALYLGTIHLWSRPTAQVVPKELAVGVLFAAGVTLPCWSRHASFTLSETLSLLLFALLCSLNCFSIECWESLGEAMPSHRRRPLLRWGEKHLDAVASLLAIASLVAAMWSGLRAGFFSALLAMALAAFLLLLLNRWKRKLAPPALRVLADVVLLVPAIFSLGILGFRG